MAGTNRRRSGEDDHDHEHEHVEAHLRELAAIVESSGDAIVGNAPDGTITSWNAAAERLFGYSAAEATGRSIAVLEPGIRRGEIDELLARLRTGERIENHQTVRARKDGTLVDVSLTLAPIQDPGGRVIGTSTIARDVSELQRAAEALRRSEESYRELFERHPAPMWLVDPATLGFLAVNDAAVESYGYSRRDFLTMTIEQISPAEDRAAVRDAENLVRHRKQDGTLIEVAVSTSAVEFEGRPARLVLAQDVSEQHRLEEQALSSLKLAPVITKTSEVLAKHLRDKIAKEPATSAQLLRTWIAEEEAS